MLPASHDFFKTLQMVSFPVRPNPAERPWYLRYSLSYRDLEEMMLERGVKVDYTTIYRLGASAHSIRLGVRSEDMRR